MSIQPVYVILKRPMEQGSIIRSGIDNTRLIVLVGPTAVGKTAVGIKLAQRLGGEIISADSMAVYKGMDIGTAKPTIEEQKQAVFHMIDVVEPDEPFTVVDFAEQASSTIDNLLAKGVWPILLGGTGFYVRAVVDGLDIPEAGPDPGLRSRLMAEAEEKGKEAVYERLKDVDPRTAERLHVNDVKRVIRALEVYEQTGVPMSELHEADKHQVRYPDARWYGLTMDREHLYKRIEQRVDQLIRDGLVEEVRELLDKGYETSLPSMQGLGYKEIIGCLKGEYSFEEAVDLLKRSTRRFAKRQFTWFHPDSRIQWIDVEGKTADQVAEIIEERLL